MVVNVRSEKWMLFCTRGNAINVVSKKKFWCFVMWLAAAFPPVSSLRICVSAIIVEFQEYASELGTMTLSKTYIYQIFEKSMRSLRKSQLCFSRFSKDKKPFLFLLGEVYRTVLYSVVVIVLVLVRSHYLRGLPREVISIQSITRAGSMQ
jgi:hypothetical protein